MQKAFLIPLTHDEIDEICDSLALQINAIYERWGECEKTRSLILLKTKLETLIEDSLLY